jgi:hypothetical protein
LQQPQSVQRAGFFMCKGCWIEADKPNIKNNLTKSVAKMIERVYDFSMSGGNAHIVVDDWNIEDNHIDFCLQMVLQNVEKYDQDQLDAEKEFLMTFKLLDEEERYSALALYEGFI